MPHCICTAGGTRPPAEDCDLCGGRPDHFKMAGPVPEKELGMFIEMANAEAAPSSKEESKTKDTSA